MDKFLETNDLIFLLVWSVIGSSLGYFALVNITHRSLTEKIKRYFLSVGTGVFLSIPVCLYLIENHHCSKLMSILIGGLCAFGLPDFIFKHWSKVVDKTVNKVIDNKL